jgi:actin related protein 2/3 complex subunit 1A/1B
MQGANNRIMPGIQCFAWNADGSLVAICPTNQEIWIFETASSPDISKWTRVKVLKEHFNVITSLDWHPKTNLLLSASADRGIIVWEMGKDNTVWLPQLGVIKEQRANLDASWNMRGDKLAVASSSGQVYVGKFSSDNNFWVAHAVNVKKPIHKASVTCVRFDPMSSRVICSASLDGTVQITSSYYEELDAASSAGPFGNVTSYGENLVTITCNGWINSLSFSPSGKALCYVTHDCELNFLDVTEIASGNKKPKSEKLLHTGNPHMSCVYLAEDKLIATGFDKVPILYKNEGGSWKNIKTLDDGILKERATKISGNSFLDKKVYFNSDFKLDNSVMVAETDTKHANYINCLKVYARNGDKVMILSTSDINGYLNFWDV